jgi:hypothetical protein
MGRVKEWKNDGITESRNHGITESEFPNSVIPESQRAGRKKYYLNHRSTCDC